MGGTVTPDTYIVDRFDPKERKILSKKVAEKTSSIWLNATYFDNEHAGTYERDNVEPNAQALSDDQIIEVANLVARVEEERYDGLPVDAEWAFHDGNLYLLQARPVTAYIPLFKEMVTERGKEKKLYLDIMVMVSVYHCISNVNGSFNIT